MQQPVYQTGRTSRVPASEIFFERTVAERFVRRPGRESQTGRMAFIMDQRPTQENYGP
jgi:hypothetical protein